MPPKKRGEVQLARGRLKGALQDLVVSDDDDDGFPKRYLPARGRPPKKMKREESPDETATVQQTYIMKLFDRSVDLAKYKENTALYPICRAWMINQPRSRRIPNLKRAVTPPPFKRHTVDVKIDTTDKLKEILSLPAPSDDIDIERQPSPTLEQKSIDKDNVNLDYDLDEPIMEREDILREMGDRWKAIRKKHQDHTIAYANAKYEASFKIFEAIYDSNSEPNN